MKIRGIEFGNVICTSVASNFFGEAWPQIAWLHKMIPGFGKAQDQTTLMTRTTTWSARDGIKKGSMPLDENYFPKELIPDCLIINWIHGWMLDATGLTGPGAKVLFEDGRWQAMTKPFILSFMPVGESHLDRINETRLFMEELARRRRDFCAPFALQLDISCPNVGHKQSEIFCELHEMLKVINRHIKDLPVIVKFNVLIRHDDILRIAQTGLIDAITISDILPWGQVLKEYIWGRIAKGVEAPEEEQLLHGCRYRSPLRERGINGDGGLSGDLVRDPILQWIRKARNIGVGLTIIASGITKPEHVIEMRDAGADMAAIGSVRLLKPWHFKAIVHQAISLDWTRKKG